MQYNYLDSIGLCKGVSMQDGKSYIGHLQYYGAGRYALQNVVDIDTTDFNLFVGYNTQTIFVDITSICEFTKMYDKNGTPVFNNDVISDNNGNCYYIYWNSTKSAYMSLPLNNENSELTMDISQMEVCGNLILESECINDENL